MNIGFLVSSNYALGNRGNGVLAQANYQVEALTLLGHKVTKLNPWEWSDINDYDVIQFFHGGLNLYGIQNIKAKMRKGILVFAPIIDSNQPNISYRLASYLGGIHSRLHTIPGELAKQGNGSDLVICRSHHEKDRLVHGLGIDADKIEIVLNGAVMPQAADDTLYESVKTQYGLPDDYVLHISAYTQARKNVLRLAEAITDIGYPLVIAGVSENGPILERLQALAKRNKNIILLGFLDRSILNCLYANCRVFCLPSIHEGTGLVALEAGVYGANVVITQNGGPKDYFLEFAEYVDPLSVDSIKTALANAWQKPRTDMLKKHIINELSWENSAKRLVEAYSKTLHA